MYIIDRRLNPKGKNIGNRQRFIRRARAEISKVVQEASSRRNVADIGQGDRVVILTALSSIFWMGILFVLFLADYMTRLKVVN